MWETDVHIAKNNSKTKIMKHNNDEYVFYVIYISFPTVLGQLLANTNLKKTRKINENFAF